MNPTSSQPGLNPRDLFLEALERSVSQRAAFLDGACRGDSTLRAAVDELLTHHQEDSFLENGAVLTPTIITAPSEQPGERIGRYKLLQQTGEGGFGTVWMAEQFEPVTRRVALKIIKLGMDTKEVIARFEAERQALAMMDNANISKVLDAGATDKGRPFFVIRDGRTIKVVELLDKAGKNLESDLTSQPRRKATLRATLGTTCQSLGLALQAIPLQEQVRDFIATPSARRTPTRSWR